MPRPVTSLRLSDIRKRQLAELISATGLTQSEVMSTAIDRMYQQEIAMNPELMTEDEHDPRLMTVEERALFEAIRGVKLPPQTDEQRYAALRRQAAKLNEPDDRPMSMNNINYMSPDETE